MRTWLGHHWDAGNVYRPKLLIAMVMVSKKHDVSAEMEKE
jgi:hypothetical protein